jgi:hypothetical protein
MSTDAEVKSRSRISATELWIGALIFSILLALRWFYTSTRGWDSDEPQHLHVVWGWLNGLLPYRDVFDNHMPLFQLLSVPLFALLGERPEIVTAMRWAMVPLMALGLVAIYLIGSRVFSRRIGFWGAVIAAALPPIYFKMGEYRPDVLWGVIWLLILAVVSGGRLRQGRLFIVGFLFGIAFCVSMKTTFLLLIFVAAALATFGVRFCQTKRIPDFPRIVKGTAIALCGMLIVPLLTVLFFASQDALGPMYYCVIGHNLLPAGTVWQGLGAHLDDPRLWLFIPVLVIGTLLVSRTENGSQMVRRLFFLLVVSLFCPVLFATWPLITKQDYIPFFTILSPVVAAFLVWAGDRIHKATNGVSPAFLLLTVAVGGEFVWMIKSCPPFEDRNKDEQAVIADTLKLTHSGETVLDAKGQAIFRRRPYYYVLETITRARANKGEIVDDVPERLIAERTPVLVRCHWLTEVTDQFVKQNYVSVGSVMVLGKKLTPPPDRKLRFEVTVPGKYVMIDDDGDASGKLNGVDWREPRELAPGTYTLILDEVPKALAIVWARAVEKGYSPFVGTPQ